MQSTSGLKAPSRDVSKSGARFLWVLAVSLCVGACCLLAFVFAVAGGAPGKSASSSATYIYYWKEKKRDIARETTSPRLFIVGGSASLYGFRAGEIARSLNINVINYGLHAGLGLDYILYSVKPLLKPGDVVLLVPEYEMLTNPDPFSWTLADYALQFDIAYLFDGDLISKLKLFTMRTPKEYFERARDRLENSLVDGTHFRVQLSGFGDLLINEARHRFAEGRERISNYAQTDIMTVSISDRAAGALGRFANWAKANRVTLLGSFQPFYRFDNLDAIDRSRLAEELKGLYRLLNVKMAGEPSQFLVDREALFDSHNHLTVEAAYSMSARMSAALHVVLPEASRRAAHTLSDVSIFFSTQELPSAVESLANFSVAEPWGRWALDGVSKIRYKAVIRPETKVVLDVLDVPRGKIGRPFKLGVGDYSSTFFVTGSHQRVELKVDCTSCSNELVITAPGSLDSETPQDGRALGIGLKSIEVLAP